AITAPATAATVQAALVALTNVGTSNMTVTGSSGGPYTVTAAGNLVGLTPGAMPASAGTLGGTGSHIPSVAVLSTGITATHLWDFVGNLVHLFVNVNHNTYNVNRYTGAPASLDGFTGMVWLSDGGSTPNLQSHQAKSVQSNICWAFTQQSHSAIMNQGNGGINDIADPAFTGFNCSFN